MSLEMGHKVIVPPKKNYMYVLQFLKQRDINSYFLPSGLNFTFFTFFFADLMPLLSFIFWLPSCTYTRTVPVL
jgi:hypothetical protein